MSVDFQAYIANQKKIIDFHLAQALKSLYSSTQKDLYQAMAYSLLAKGKRLRPMIALATCESAKGDVQSFLGVACALEMIHTYSLIQDDLPCMDDDDYRRFQLTCHKVYGEGLSMLASDALLTEAIRLILQSVKDKEVGYLILDEVLSSIGVLGMLSGQALDIKNVSSQLDEVELTKLHGMKTGALFRAAVRSGALFAKAGPEDMRALTIFAESLGLTFQIVDDVLDVIASQSHIGKMPKADHRLKKTTFVDLLGIDKAKEKARHVMNQGLGALVPLGPSVEILRKFGQEVLERLDPASPKG